VVSGCLGGVGGRHRSRRSPGSSARDPTRPLLRSPCPARGPASVAAGGEQGTRWRPASSRSGWGTSVLPSAVTWYGLRQV
jgi:hypothetical protein